jgi:hypothetical protein
MDARAVVTETKQPPDFLEEPRAKHCGIAFVHRKEAVHFVAVVVASR